MLPVTITMTVDTVNITPDNLGTTITNSVTNAVLNRAVPPNSQLDEIVVNPDDTITIQMQPLNGNTKTVCNVLGFAAKPGGGNLNSFFGPIEAGGSSNRQAILISSVKGAIGSTFSYVLTLNVNGTTYIFDPKIKVNIVHPKPPKAE